MFPFLEWRQACDCFDQWNTGEIKVCDFQGLNTKGYEMSTLLPGDTSSTSTEPPWQMSAYPKAVVLRRPHIGPLVNSPTCPSAL